MLLTSCTSPAQNNDEASIQAEEIETRPSKQSCFEQMLKKGSELNTLSLEQSENFLSWFDQVLQSRQTHFDLSPAFSIIHDDFWTCAISDQNYGLGHLLLRADRGNIFLQAPHRFHDQYTAKIAIEIASMLPQVNVLFVNSINRKVYDYAREKDSLLIKLSERYLAVTDNSLIVQLHGFSQQKRRNKRARNSNIIISSGNRKMKQYSVKLAQCLIDMEFEGVSVYGVNVNELGGTKNPAAVAFSKPTSEKFLHIELSKPLRKELVKNSQLLGQLTECLKKVTE